MGFDVRQGKLRWWKEGTRLGSLDLCFSMRSLHVSMEEEILPMPMELQRQLTTVHEDMATDMVPWDGLVNGCGEIRDFGLDMVPLAIDASHCCSELEEPPDPEVSPWVRKKIMQFYKSVGLSLASGLEDDILKLFLALEKGRKVKQGVGTVSSKKDKGSRELRNLVCLVNYDGNHSSSGGSSAGVSDGGLLLF